MVDEVREFVERYGRGRIGTDEMALFMTMMSSQGFSLDGQSFLLGALLGSNMPRSVLIPFALALNQNPANMQGTAGTATGPMGNSVFPFLMLSLLNRDDADGDEKIRVIEKAAAKASR